MQTQTAFTLLELLITLALITILSTLTFPHFKNFSSDSQAKAQGKYFMHMLALARSEALLRGMTVTICGSSDKSTCTNHWADGQIIFLDAENNAVVASKDNLLYVLAAANPAGTLYWRSSLHRDYLSFYPSGMTHGEDGTFWYCGREKQHASWAVVVNQVGRIRYVEEASALISYTCHGATNNP